MTTHQLSRARVALATALLTFALAGVAACPAIAGGWSIVPSANAAGAPDGVLRGLACASATSCIAVGYYVDATGEDAMLTERWDGTSWAVQSVPRPPGAIRSALSAISCTAASACTAVGDYINGSGTSVPLAERWDGNAWTVQSVPTRQRGGAWPAFPARGPTRVPRSGSRAGLRWLRAGMAPRGRLKGRLPGLVRCPPSRARRRTDDAPWVPLTTQSTIDFVSARVGNYQYRFQQGVLVDQLWVR
jgi:hypothetical protein